MNNEFQIFFVSIGVTEAKKKKITKFMKPKVDKTVVKDEMTKKKKKLQKYRIFAQHFTHEFLLNTS